MRYIGSKATAADAVLAHVCERVPSGSVCDPFAGVGTIGSAFKRLGFRVTTGDHLRMPYVFQVARIQLSRMPQFKGLSVDGKRSVDAVEHYFNSLTPKSGWLDAEFARKRKFFTLRNARRIEAVRSEIERLTCAELITEAERSLLLASLIESMDRVANTAGTYYAYLKTFTRRALNPFQFSLIRPTKGLHRCKAIYGSAFDTVASNYYDILYLDPPYNCRDYASYYHLPETIARQERSRSQKMSGVPDIERPRSAFACRSTAADALDELISAASFNLLVFHYADNGLIAPATVRKIVRQYGGVEEIEIAAQSYTTRSHTRLTQHKLYLVENG